MLWNFMNNGFFIRDHLMPSTMNKNNPQKAPFWILVNKKTKGSTKSFWNEEKWWPRKKPMHCTNNTMSHWEHWLLRDNWAMPWSSERNRLSAENSVVETYQSKTTKESK